MTIKREQKYTENPRKDTYQAHSDGRIRAGYKLLPEKLAQFLEALAHNGNISMSARMIGMSRSTILKFAHKNPEFRLAMDEAIEDAKDFALGELLRRGLQGWKEPVWYRGQEVGTVRKFSDACLIRYVEAHHSQFRRRERQQQTVPSLVPETADLTKLTDAELDFLERVLIKLDGDSDDSS